MHGNAADAAVPKDYDPDGLDCGGVMELHINFPRSRRYVEKLD
jgi:hypothetical protein